MPKLSITCPHCSARLLVSQERIGSGPVKCPKCNRRFAAAAAKENQPGAVTEKVPSPHPLSDTPSSIPVIRTDGEQSLNSRRRQRAHLKRGALWPITLLLLLAASAAGSFVWWSLQTTPLNISEDVLDKKTSPVKRSQPDSDAANSPAPDSPPVSLTGIPVSPQLLIHLRPAILWNGRRVHQEFMATLGNVTQWLRDRIENTSHLKVETIDSATIAVNFGSRTSQPDVAWILRMQDPLPRPAFLQELSAIPSREVDSVFLTDAHSWIFPDDVTIGIAPRELAQHLSDAMRYPAIPAPELEQLLSQSDASRPLTLLADLHVLDEHKQSVLIPELQDLAEAAMVWMGRDCRVLSCDLNMAPHLQMRTKIIPRAETAPSVLRGRLQRQLRSLPEEIALQVQQMKPQSRGHRRIVGRFPAMLQAMSMGTTGSHASNIAKFSTVLPKKAGPNLAAAAVLTWNQTLLAPPAHAIPSPVRPSLIDRLQRSVLVDFRQEPLQAAMAYLAVAADIELSIDGDALMLSGFTQNMPQTMDLGEASVAEAIAAILKQYGGKMVLVRVPPGGLQLTTQDVADENSQKIYQLP